MANKSRRVVGTVPWVRATTVNENGTNSVRYPGVTLTQNNDKPATVAVAATATVSTALMMGV